MVLSVIGCCLLCLERSLDWVVVAWCFFVRCSLLIAVRRLFIGSCCLWLVVFGAVGVCHALLLAVVCWRRRCWLLFAVAVCVR